MLIPKKISLNKVFLIVTLSIVFCNLSIKGTETIPPDKNKSKAIEALTQQNDKKARELKKKAFNTLEQLSVKLDSVAGQIWEFAEIALEEYKSSKLLGDLLENNEFKVEFGVGGLPTAFVATYGSGQPVIGILGEFDALPGLSQKAGTTEPEALVANAPGHGCGHNLLGVASAGAAIAVKNVMQNFNLKGTIKFFGCPAEETVEGKTYMARDGVFNGLDICFDWHPSDLNEVILDTSNALNNFEVSFRGKTAHAAGDPWNGRSALDALELFNHGINCLREHVPTTVRMHYIIRDGGHAPNVVPDYARGWYYVRGKDRQEVEEVYARVLKIAEGAAMMTETSHEIYIITGVYNYLTNRTIAALLYENLQLVEPPSFTEEEQEFARQLQRKLGIKEQGMSTVIKPFEEPEKFTGGGSTDAADVSWLVPMAAFIIASSPLDIPGHHWGIVSCSASSLGYKCMHTAAKVISASAIDALLNPSIIQKAQEEFKEKTKGFVYKCAIPENQKPRTKKK